MPEAGHTGDEFIFISKAKAPISPETGAFAVRRLPEEEWQALRHEHDLSIEPRRIFFSNPIPVEVHFAPLRAARNREVSRLQFDLGVGVPVTAEVIHRFDHGEEAWSLAGKLGKHPHSEFSVSVYDDAVVGTFKSPLFGTPEPEFTGSRR